MAYVYYVYRAKQWIMRLCRFETGSAVQRSAVTGDRRSCEIFCGGKDRQQAATATKEWRTSRGGLITFDAAD